MPQLGLEKQTRQTEHFLQRACSSAFMQHWDGFSGTFNVRQKLHDPILIGIKYEPRDKNLNLTCILISFTIVKPSLDMAQVD